MATYYVRPDGNNSNAGTGPATNQAWATLTKALQTMAAGDQCYVAPGTYRENVSFTNQGTSDSVRIKLLGDPWCAQFPGLTPGEVVVNGLTSEAHTAPSTGLLFDTKSYINVENINFYNMVSTVTFQGAHQILRNCRLHVNIASNNPIVTVSASSTGPVVSDCVFTGAAYAVSKNSNCYGTFTRCIFKQMMSRFMTHYSGGLLTFEFCYIEGQVYDSSGTNWGGELVFKGCVIKPGPMENVSTGGNFIYLANTTDTGCVHRFYGCLIEGWKVLCDSASRPMHLYNCLYLRMSSYLRPSPTGLNLYGRQCFVEHADYPIYASADGSFSYLDFERSGLLAYIDTGRTLSLTNVRIHASRTATLKSGSGTLSCSPTYGAFEQSAGNIVTATNPITGAKSLKMQGWLGAQPYVQWVACEKGKAKTIKMNVKLSNTSDSLTVTIGNQSVTASATTNVQVLTITYTHWTTELVPLWVCATPRAALDAYVLVDDIAA